MRRLKGLQKECNVLANNDVSVCENILRNLFYEVRNVRQKPTSGLNYKPASGGFVWFREVVVLYNPRSGFFHNTLQ